MSSSLLAVAVLLAAWCAAAHGSAVSAAPGEGYLAIDPVFTPFATDGSVNTAVVPAMAAWCKKMGADVILLGGSTGNWPAMTADERITLLKAWKTALTAMGSGAPKLMFHVGDTDLATAKTLASTAESIGVDSILSVAPCIIKPGTVAELVWWLQQVTAAAPHTPFVYYHFPALYNVDFPMADLVEAALKNSALPTLSAIKYIEDNIVDLMSAAYEGSATSQKVVMYPESPLAVSTIPFGAQGSPCTSTQIPYMRNATNLFAGGDIAGAGMAQRKLVECMGAGAGFSGDTGRAIWSVMSGIDLGPPRAPNVGVDPSEFSALKAQVKAKGCWPSEADA